MIKTGGIDELLEEITRQVGTDYPPEVTAPAEITYNDHLTNFLRSGPFRKTFLFSWTGGDYEYDENMSLGEEIRMELNNDEIFITVSNRCAALFGKPGLERPDEPIFSVTDHEDSSGELNSYDGVAWTPDYEKGAVFENVDSSDMLYWEAEKEYIILQKGKWTGDGNFLFFVLMTITPRTT